MEDEELLYGGSESEDFDPNEIESPEKPGEEAPQKNEETMANFETPKKQDCDQTDKPIISPKSIKKEEEQKVQQHVAPPVQNTPDIMESMIDYGGFEPGTCEEHGGLNEVVCISDRVLLCAKCALFGEHVGHQFKELSEVITEVIERADQYVPFK